MDSEVGRFKANVFTSSAWIVKPKEIITSIDLHEIEASFCISCSYRRAENLLNTVFHRQSDSSICLKTLSDRLVSEGKKINKCIDIQTRRILAEHNLDPDTALPLNNCSEHAAISPAEEGKRASQEFKEIIESYNKAQDDCDKIKDNNLVDKTETDPSNCVYISVDDVGVSHQKDTRKNGGTKDGQVVENTVIHIETENGEYRIAAIGMDKAFARLVAFLASNELLSGKNLVFFSDGASNIRCAIEKYFKFYPYALILDWFHLEKRMYEFISMSIKGNKKSKQDFRYRLDKKLWAGNIQDAIQFLKAVPSDNIRNSKILDDAVAYLERKRPFIACYAIRKLLRYRNSSNPGEKSNDILCAQRQKHNGMSWSNNGSGGLTIITTLIKNNEYDAFLRSSDIPFKLVKKCA